jgi:hypothetical protein
VACTYARLLLVRHSWEVPNLAHIVACRFGLDQGRLFSRARAHTQHTQARAHTTQHTHARAHAHTTQHNTTQCNTHTHTARSNSCDLGFLASVFSGEMLFGLGFRARLGLWGWELGKASMAVRSKGMAGVGWGWWSNRRAVVGYG